MSGYVPIFDTVLDGTLFGKWPHTGIWVCLLSQVDQHGEIDMHPSLLAAKIGVSVDTLLACINDFMQPDPASRTNACEGRRLELIDADARQWGWRVVNHAKYREKARLKSKNEREVESGKNKDRMDDRRRPPVTAADPLSTQLNSTQTQLNATHRAAPTAEAEVAIALRDLGVAVTSIDPVLVGWVRDGITAQQAVDAVGIARIRKPHPEVIPANYLDKILRQPQRKPTDALGQLKWRPGDDSAPI